ncbi:hypothetical protein Glove_139g107 [Diversispora epigaea]|uniref:Uncharacterized protein n=1 Tax=Diversispora epigaea TaxID=1348612 RepID=A0A397IZL1_9GLOM|nr:hypothetical protein Glove_139g107 [Diversispora epigaea]
MKDEEKAVQWYMKSAEGGDSTGQYNLGYCYQHGIGTTKGKRKHSSGSVLRIFVVMVLELRNEKKAWYMKSAEEGNSNGQNGLGYCYQHGIGTTKNEKKAFQCGTGTAGDEEEAFQWYLKSAEGENYAGQNNLAEGGNNYGQYNLGHCYCNGIGTMEDKKKNFSEKAFQWYMKSAEEGNHLGQRNLDYCNQYGIGTMKDEKSISISMHLISAEGGDSLAQNSLENYYKI